MIMTINYIAVTIIEALIFWFYCTPIFEPRTTTGKRILAFSVSYFLLYLLLYFNSFIINISSFLLVNFVLIFTAYNTKWYTALFHSAIMDSIMVLSEIFVAVITAKPSFDFYNSSVYVRNIVLLAIFSKTLYFVVSHIISKLIYNTRSNGYSSRKENFLVTTIPILSIVVILLVVLLCNDTTFTDKGNFIIAFIIILMFIIDFLTVSIYNYVHKKNEEFTKTQLQVQNDSLSIDYYKMLLNQNETQNILIHDIKKHLQSISALNQQHESDKIDAYINRIINTDELQGSIRVCNHELLNTILCRYSHECKINHIDFRIDIRSHVLTTFPDNDLTALFCNMLDNAFESANIIPDSFIELNVSKKQNTPFTLITMINSCRVNPLNPKTGELSTTKKDKLNHGYGMKSIKRIVNKYTGTMNIHYNDEDNTFHTIILLKL